MCKLCKGKLLTIKIEGDEAEIVDYFKNNKKIENVDFVNTFTKKGIEISRCTFNVPDDNDFFRNNSFNNNFQFIFKRNTTDKTLILDMFDIPGNSITESYFCIHETISDILVNLATRYKGNLKCINFNCDVFLIENGITIKKSHIDITNTDIELISDNEGVYNFGITVKEFLQENVKIQEELKAQKFDNITDKLNFIGLTILKYKTADEIPYSAFIDLFRQIVIMGANHPTINKFKKVLL